MARRTENMWQIVSLDPEVQLLIVGEFDVDETLDTDRTPNLDSSSSPGSSGPTTQWVSAGPHTWRFSSQVRSRHRGQDIRPQLRDLESLREVHPLLGRAPRIALSMGTSEIRGFVARLQIRVGRRWPNSPIPRAVQFDIELLEREVTPGGDLGVEGETQYLRLRSGESLELYGLRYLGDPLKGDLIRRENPGVVSAGEVAGLRVRVYEADHPALQGPVRPSGVPFQDRDGRRAVWHPVVEALATQRGSADDPGLPWDLLPDVLAGSIDTDAGLP